MLPRLPFALAAVASLSLLASAASAEEQDPAAEGVRTYAAARLRESASLALAGAASVAGGGVAFAGGSRFGQALGVPLLAGGALELGLAGSALVSTLAWQASAGAALSSGDGATAAVELARVDRQRAWSSVTEAALATVVGAGVLTSYFGAGNDTLRGGGLGVALDAGVLLTADVVAGFRADGYAAALRGASFAVSPDRRTALMTFTGKF